MALLSRLLGEAGLSAADARDPEITAIEDDSRRCGPGSLFVAVPGFHVDGRDYVADAVARGAAAVVMEPPAPAALAVPVVTVSDSRSSLAALAAAFFSHPSRELVVAGVTGTDGKTTTATMLWAAWRSAGLSAASLTTVDWRANDRVEPNKSRQTTLEAPELQRRLLALRTEGVSHVALETSSHALVLHRVDGIAYRAAVYTRITSEHLDIHGSRDAYLDAKAQLLRMTAGDPRGVAVLDAADDFAYPVLAAIPVAQRLTYSTDSRVDADLVAERVVTHAGGVDVRARTPWGAVEFSLQLAGAFNAANALAALAAACATGAPLEAAARGLAGLERVTGRMERVDLGQPFAVVVDYAHTAGALERALTELRPSTKGRLWVVFGSAGERDVEKRPAMGAVAARLADVSVITDEDPRDEDRFQILEDIAAGATASGGRRGDDVVIVPERAEAIQFALEHAAPGDTVLLAGKGHEGSILAGPRTVAWDERQVAEEALRRLPR